MKKLALTILGLFTLMACGEDVYQENIGDVSEDSGYTVFTDDSGPGQTGYLSPFDNQTCCSIITYIFDNTTTDLVLEFVPYVGLSRFDDTYDTTHFGWSIPLNVINYPNLLLGNDEYFNLVACNLVSVAPGATDIEQNVQLPIGPGQYFTIVPPSTNAEWTILNEYGKLYAIDAIIKDTSGNILATDRLRFPFLAPGVTQPPAASGFLPMPVHPINPQPEQYDLWYHKETKEICIGSDPEYATIGGGGGLSGLPSELVFTHEYAPGQYRDYILSLTTDLTTVRISLQ